MTDYYRINNDHLKEKQKELKLRLDNGKTRRITVDGPITDEYNNARPRILWVLREPDGDGDGSLINDVLSDFLSRSPKWSYWLSTWGLLAKTSYGLLNKCDPFAIWEGNRQLVKESVRSVAVINLNKFGGPARKSPYYPRGVDKCAELLRWQLDNLSPDIIIFGSTCWDYRSRILFPTGMDIPENCSPSKKGFPSFRAGNDRIYISAYHTRQTVLKHRVYYKYIQKALENPTQL